uniref:Uncharacterized protein n=1 Tax=Ixodes ricinus TaxID=34613 RepID=A0A6B0UN44_IXORI
MTWFSVRQRRTAALILPGVVQTNFTKVMIKKDYKGSLLHTGVLKVRCKIYGEGLILKREKRNLVMGPILKRRAGQEKCVSNSEPTLMRIPSIELLLYFLGISGSVYFSDLIALTTCTIS